MEFDKTLNISQIQILTFLGGVIVREPDGSSGIADTACFFAIPHQVREQACPHAWHGAAEKRSASAIPKAPLASLLPSASADGLKGFRGKASSFVGFSPFYGLYLKGLKPTEEPAKPGQSTIRLLKQTAKERLRGGALGMPILIAILIYIRGGIGHPKRKRSFLRKA